MSDKKEIFRVVDKFNRTVLSIFDDGTANVTNDVFVLFNGIPATLADAKTEAEAEAAKNNHARLDRRLSALRYACSEDAEQRCRDAARIERYLETGE